MTDTTNLGITLLTASQSQKHVTVNEGFSNIDDKLGGGFNAASGAYCKMATYTEDVAVTGATTSTSGLLPNRGVVLGVSVHVTVAVTGATSFDVGNGSTYNQYGGTIGVSLGTKHSAPANDKLWSPSEIVLTANGGNFTGGTVRVIAHIMEVGFE